MCISTMITQLKWKRKRKQVRGVIKSVKEKSVKAHCLYPAQLKIFQDTGTKVFLSLLEAQPTVKELGINMEVTDVDKLERELLQDQWSTQGERGKRKGKQLIHADLRNIRKIKRDVLF